MNRSLAMKRSLAVKQLQEREVALGLGGTTVLMDYAIAGVYAVDEEELPDVVEWWVDTYHNVAVLLQTGGQAAVDTEILSILFTELY